jgi:hypothetical protein
MFNRQIEFKVTKPAPPDPPSILSKDEELEMLAYKAEFARSLVMDAAKLVAGYMILDTFRKSLIALASK